MIRFIVIIIQIYAFDKYLIACDDELSRSLPVTQPYKSPMMECFEPLTKLDSSMENHDESGLMEEIKRQQMIKILREFVVSDTDTDTDYGDIRQLLASARVVNSLRKLSKFR